MHTRLTICSAIVNLVFPRLGFWSGNFFLIAPFPDHCLLVPFNILLKNIVTHNLQIVGNNAQARELEAMLNMELIDVSFKNR